MRFLSVSFLAISALLLAACGEETSDQPKEDISSEQQTPSGDSKTLTYQCADDTNIEVTYAGETAVVVEGNNNYLMTQAVSGSGARYVSDEGMEWHVKGNEGAYGSEDDTQMCTLDED